uniref:DM13 domain-containing protein n=1 Tax=Romanomermis culicivorax TaxID=13658 RepID=A0A915JTR9_ROMCU
MAHLHIDYANFKLMDVFFDLLALHHAYANDSKYGDFIGSFRDNWLEDQNINGQVYAVNKTCLQIIDFYFDENICGSAYFWLSHDLVLSQHGEPVSSFEYEDQHLKAYRNVRAIINFPFNTELRDFGSFGLWCQETKSKLAYVTIPSTLEPPNHVILNQSLEINKHGRRYRLKAGPFVILDRRTIKVYGFSIQRKSPATYFTVGRGAPVTKKTINKVRVKGYDETGRDIRPLPVGGNYSAGADLILELPENFDVFNIEWLGVYCKQFALNLGHIKIGNLSYKIQPYLRPPYSHFPSELSINKTATKSWPRTILLANQSMRSLRFELGPPGHSKAYAAWYNSTPNYLVWYINDLLAPELIVEVDVEYSFQIEGGCSNDSSATHHLYISGDSIGGRKDYHDYDGGDDLQPHFGGWKSVNSDYKTSKNRCCILYERVGTDASYYSSFNAYEKNLRKNCTTADIDHFTWIPPRELINRTLYYHSHKSDNTGGRILITEKNQFPKNRKSETIDVQDSAKKNNIDSYRNISRVLEIFVYVYSLRVSLLLVKA